MNLEQELCKNEILLSVFSQDYYNASLLGVVKELKHKKICYVTLNKTSAGLEKYFHFHQVNTNNLFFIDAVSKSVTNSPHQDNVLLISSPAALTELSIAITEALKLGVFDLVLFDSLSTLNIYSLKGRATEKFTYQLINKIKSKQKQGIFTCLEGDLETSLVKNSFMYVDKVLHPSFFTAYRNKKRKNLALAAISALLLLMAVPVFFTSSSLTGMVTLNTLDSSRNLLYLGGFFSFVVIFFIIGATVYKKISLRLISDEDLKNIKPGKSEADKIRKSFRNKILSWFKKTHQAEV
ncbi:MAG: hypothetical protein KKH52_04690 [Nanoarchaeota archaeon]|nr:hypothetical protein [Nanoarchaeota archaeon]MBU1622996.1 hypothetical protein [Nanoarchaeota archaeon]MBU1974663.1 hypothetical protein [Nanoarchaeota archaeon]